MSLRITRHPVSSANQVPLFAAWHPQPQAERESPTSARHLPFPRPMFVPKHSCTIPHEQNIRIERNGLNGEGKYFGEEGWEVSAEGGGVKPLGYQQPAEVIGQ